MLIKSYYVENDEQYDWLMKHIEEEYPGLTWFGEVLPTHQESFGSPIIAIEECTYRTRIVHVPDLVTYFDDAQEDGYAPMPIPVESLMDCLSDDSDGEYIDMNIWGGKSMNDIKSILKNFYNESSYNRTLTITGLFDTIWNHHKDSSLFTYCYGTKSHNGGLDMHKRQLNMAQAWYEIINESESTECKSRHSKDDLGRNR